MHEGSIVTPPVTNLSHFQHVALVPIRGFCSLGWGFPVPWVIIAWLSAWSLHKHEMLCGCLAGCFSCSIRFIDGLVAATPLDLGHFRLQLPYLRQNIVLRPAIPGGSFQSAQETQTERKEQMLLTYNHQACVVAAVLRPAQDGIARASAVRVAGSHIPGR